MRVRFNDKMWDKEAIQSLIDTNDKAVSRALMVIYANQTADEKSAGHTVHHNSIGFTGRDAEFLTDIAKKWQFYGRWASRKQMNAVRRSIRKYWRQLLLEMIEKGGEQIKGRLKPEDQPDLIAEDQPDLIAEEMHQVIEPQRLAMEGSW